MLPANSIRISYHKYATVCSEKIRSREKKKKKIQPNECLGNRLNLSQFGLFAETFQAMQTRNIYPTGNGRDDGHFVTSTKLN